MASETVDPRPEIPREAWASLLSLLGGGPDAGAGYERMRRKLVDFFRWKGCTDAEELADATFDRVAKKLAAGEAVQTDEPARYVIGVARLIYLESVKKDVRRKRALADGLPEPDAGEGDDERRIAALEDCLGAVGERARQTLLLYHLGRGQGRIDARQKLAEEHGITLNTLRIRMHRLREQLADCVRRNIS